MSKEPHIDETLERLTDLVHGYQRAMDCSNEIITMKNRMIELCELETALYKRESKRLQKID